MATAVRLGVNGYGHRIHGLIHDLIHGPFGEVEPDLRLAVSGKPVAISVEQALALERAYENAAAAVVSFPLRVSPLCESARDYLADGTVGEPVHVPRSWIR